MSVAVDEPSELERAAAWRDAAIRSTVEAIAAAPITPVEACQTLRLYWWLLPKPARRLLIAVDVDEIPDGFDMADVNASWEQVPMPLREWLFWAWWVYLLREWLEVACERSRAEHVRVRADFRASGLRLRHDPRFDALLAADVPARVRDRERRPRQARPRSSRRRPRAPPAAKEPDPEPEQDVDRARRGGCS